MKPKALMVLGTGSGVGKSFITAGLCRVLNDRGLRVAPFKAQNMSNNSFVTREGGEMGRAQAVQAECARVEPSVHMNPVLLKPAADDESQVVIHGKAVGHMRAQTYYGLREKIWLAIRESYQFLSERYEAIVIEGAGSPAEINLKEFDLVNFRTAEMADASCLLVGDIDKGGVFAWLVGTLALLTEAERERIVGFVINKFRGDQSLLKPGLEMLEKLSGKKVLGVLPYATDLWIEEEDSLSLESLSNVSQPESLDIAVVLLPRISNATDFQILGQEPGVSVRMIRRAEEMGEPDLLILPGTKSTLRDLQYLKKEGLAEKIRDYVRGGGRVLGICGGFQMLGERIEDPEGVESNQRFETGLSLFPFHTRFFEEKILRQVSGRIDGRIFSQPVQANVTGYEIHMGQTRLSGEIQPLLQVTDKEGKTRSEGAIDRSGKILGTYLHGLFDEASFRGAFLEALRKDCGKPNDSKNQPVFSAGLIKEKNYERLAGLLRENLDGSFIESWLNLSLPLS